MTDERLQNELTQLDAILLPGTQIPLGYRSWLLSDQVNWARAEVKRQQFHSRSNTLHENLTADILSQTEKNTPGPSLANATIQHSPYPFAKVKIENMNDPKISIKNNKGDTVYCEVSQNLYNKIQISDIKKYEDYFNSVTSPVSPDVYFYKDKHLNSDPVNHPAHYTSGKIEVADFIEDQKLDWHLGNALKYIARAGKKDPAKLKEDLEKAVWYIQRKISLLVIFILISLAGFSQQSDSTIQFSIDTSKGPETLFLSLNKTKVPEYQIWDQAGPWLIWIKDSDTLQLIAPTKVHYIKIGKRIIKL